MWLGSVTFNVCRWRWSWDVGQLKFSFTPKTLIKVDDLGGSHSDSWNFNIILQTIQILVTFDPKKMLGCEERADMRSFLYTKRFSDYKALAYSRTKLVLAVKCLRTIQHLPLCSQYYTLRKWHPSLLRWRDRPAAVNVFLVRTDWWPHFLLLSSHNNHRPNRSHPRHS